MVLGMTLKCLPREIYLPRPGANDISCLSAVKQQLSLLGAGYATYVLFSRRLEPPGVPIFCWSTTDELSQHTGSI